MNGLDTPSISHLLVTIQHDLDHLDRLINIKDMGLMSTEKIEQLERELLEEFGKLWVDLESEENRNHVLLAEIESPEFAQQRQRIRDLIDSGELVLPGIND